MFKKSCALKFRFIVRYSNTSCWVDAVHNDLDHCGPIELLGDGCGVRPSEILLLYEKNFGRCFVEDTFNAFHDHCRSHLAIKERQVYGGAGRVDNRDIEIHRKIVGVTLWLISPSCSCLIFDMRVRLEKCLRINLLLVPVALAGATCTNVLRPNLRALDSNAFIMFLVFLCKYLSVASSFCSSVILRNNLIPLCVLGLVFLLYRFKSEVAIFSCWKGSCVGG